MVLAKLKKTWHEKVPPGPTLHPRALALVASSISGRSQKEEKEEKGKRRRGRGELQRKERRGD